MSTTTTEPDPMADILRLAEHLWARNIRARSGCWEAAVDDTWWVALNPHEHDCRCSRGPEAPAFVAYVEYNGWPAGHVSFLGDGWFAAGDGANPETFAAAVRARIARQEAPAGMKRYTVHWHAEMRRWDRWGVWVVKRDGEEVRTFPLAGMTTPAMKAAYDEARSWAHERNQREEGDDARAA